MSVRDAGRCNKRLFLSWRMAPQSDVMPGAPRHLKRGWLVKDDDGSSQKLDRHKRLKELLSPFDFRGP